MNWRHSQTLYQGEPFSIKGIDLWGNEWKATRERVSIKDPLYGQEFSFEVYEISNGNATARFAAGEFSNNVWGIYEEVGK